MSAAENLAQLLWTALRVEETQVVEEPLSCGADPNLVLADGAAATHLVARAGHPWALCLAALLRGGGDPNPRSAEKLTPLHVAATGCRCSLELLLSQGGVHGLQAAVSGIGLTGKGLDTSPFGAPNVMLDFFTALSRSDSRDMDPEPDPGPHSLLAYPEVVDKDSSLESSPVCWDCSSDASFITAVETSGAKDPASNSPFTGSLPPTRLYNTSDNEKHSPGCSWLVPTGNPEFKEPPGVPGDSQFSIPLLWELPLPLSPLTQFPLPGPNFSGYSPQLTEALRTGQIPDTQPDEDALTLQFEQLDPRKWWWEGVVKSSFMYLLLVPRDTQDLPAQAFSLTPAECLQTFVHAIFYVGKGTQAQPNVHLEAVGYRGQPEKQACPKARQILDIWTSGRGVVSLQCFQHVIAVKAYAEACLVEALGGQDQEQGHCSGVVARWSPAQRPLGVRLLHRALFVFLAKGEQELQPQDIQARG
ncbi:LOW QUALITY PROTEIN: ankyrin repeat and LEM domain-containing protein 1 [Rhynchonycteris naso]